MNGIGLFARFKFTRSQFLQTSLRGMGSFFVANLIISLFFFILYACLMLVMFGSVFGNLIQSQYQGYVP